MIIGMIILIMFLEDLSAFDVVVSPVEANEFNCALEFAEY